MRTLATPEQQQGIFDQIGGLIELHGLTPEESGLTEPLSSPVVAGYLFAVPPGTAMTQEPLACIDEHVSPGGERQRSLALGRQYQRTLVVAKGYLFRSNMALGSCDLPKNDREIMNTMSALYTGEADDLLDMLRLAESQPAIGGLTLFSYMNRKARRHFFGDE